MSYSVIDGLVLGFSSWEFCEEVMIGCHQLLDG